MLGGCSSHNQCLYVRGSPADYQYWPKNWSFAHVLNNYKNIETVVDDHLSNSYRGTNGPLRISTKQSRKNELTKHFYEACVANGYTSIEDYNTPFEQDQICSYMQFNVGIENNPNHRQDAFTTFVKPIQNQSNIEVITDVQVSRVLFKNDGETVPTAYGVEYYRHGKKYILECREEVILSAGAIGSPQILQLSGIGDKNLLQSLDIPVIKDLPGVGQELQDHLITFILYRMKQPLHVDHRNLIDVNMFVKNPLKNDRSLNDGRYYLQQYNIVFPNEIPAFNVTANTFGAESILLCPDSKGYVKINSNKHTDAPLINFNFLTEQRDVDIITEGIRRNRSIFDKLSDVVVEEVAPGRNKQSAEEIAEYIRSVAFPIFHPSGTCKMQETFDPKKSVVDQFCRVYGVNKLRVADASIMPLIVSGNTNAACLMIGDKCGEIIIQQRSQDSKLHIPSSL
jgi:choline dehydrogenase